MSWGMWGRAAGGWCTLNSAAVRQEPVVLYKHYCHPYGGSRLLSGVCMYCGVGPGASGRRVELAV